jgi:hypothetical protein
MRAAAQHSTHGSIHGGYHCRKSHSNRANNRRTRNSSWACACLSIRRVSSCMPRVWSLILPMLMLSVARLPFSYLSSANDHDADNLLIGPPVPPRNLQGSRKIARFVLQLPKVSYPQVSIRGSSSADYGCLNFVSTKGERRNILLSSDGDSEPLIFDRSVSEDDEQCRRKGCQDKKPLNCKWAE